MKTRLPEHSVEDDTRGFLPLTLRKPLSPALPGPDGPGQAHAPFFPSRHFAPSLLTTDSASIKPDSEYQAPCSSVLPQHNSHLLVYGAAREKSLREALLSERPRQKAPHEVHRTSRPVPTTGRARCIYAHRSRA